MTQKRFWISWHQLTSDYRPLQDPPRPDNIRAWWCSGHDLFDDKNHTLCAIVDAESAEQAEIFIRAAWDSNGKEIGEFRFNDEREKDWLPNDRFPITKEWEKQRLGIS